MIVVHVTFPGEIRDGRYFKDDSVYNCFSDVDLEPGNVVVCDVKERDPRLGHVLATIDPEDNTQPINGWVIQKVDMAGYRKKREDAELADLLGL